jgi:hypothetical protein
MSGPRAITAVVSKYQRARAWRGKFVRGESFQLGVNLNGALADGATIDSIIWRVLNPNSIILGAATLDDRTASVTCTAGVACGSIVKVQATASDGAVWNQLFLIEVVDLPWFLGEVPPVIGPYSVAAP